MWLWANNMLDELYIITNYFGEANNAPMSSKRLL